MGKTDLEKLLESIEPEYIKFHALAILRELGIITSYEINWDIIPKLDSDPQQDLEDLTLGDDEDNLTEEQKKEEEEKEEEITKQLKEIIENQYTFSPQTKDNIRKNSSSDAPDDIVDSVNDRLFAYTIRDAYDGVKTKVKRFDNKYIIMTDNNQNNNNSFIINIKSNNIPHLLGLPNISAIKHGNSTKLRDALVKCIHRDRTGNEYIDYDEYYEIISNFMKDETERKDWFQVQRGNQEIQKDNTDKMGYKRACLNLFLENFISDTSDLFSDKRELIIYTDNTKNEILILKNIDGTDGYVGLVCENVKDEEGNIKPNDYFLKSIVALNEREVIGNKPIELEGCNFTNGRKHIYNISLISKTEGNKKIIQEQEKEHNSELSVSDSTYNNSPFTDALKSAKTQIQNNNKFFDFDIAERITEIINIDGDEEKETIFETELSKKLLYFIITNNITYKVFINSVLLVLNNYNNFNDEIKAILSYYSRMAEEDLKNKEEKYDVYITRLNSNGKRISKISSYQESNVKDKNGYKIDITRDRKGILKINSSFSFEVSNMSQEIPYNIEINLYKNTKNIEKEFNKKIQDIYELLLSDEIKLEPADYVNYAKILYNLNSYQKIILASIKEKEIIKERILAQLKNKQTIEEDDELFPDYIEFLEREPDEIKKKLELNAPENQNEYKTILPTWNKILLDIQIDGWEKEAFCKECENYYFDHDEYLPYHMMLGIKKLYEDYNYIASKELNELYEIVIKRLNNTEDTDQDSNQEQVRRK